MRCPHCDKEYANARTLAQHGAKCRSLANSRAAGTAARPTYDELCAIVVALQREVNRLSDRVRDIDRGARREIKKKIDIGAWLVENRSDGPALETWVEDLKVSEGVLDRVLDGDYPSAVVEAVHLSSFASFQHAPQTLYCRATTGWQAVTDDQLDLIIKRIDQCLMMKFSSRSYQGEDYLKGIQQLMSHGAEHGVRRKRVRSELNRAARLTISLVESQVVTGNAE